MKRIAKAAIAAAVLSVGVMAPAGAVVTVDSSGNGFVGKGDVQTPFAWNNKQLQTNAGGVAFSLVSVVETEWTCLKTVQLGNGGVNEIVQERHRASSVQALLEDVARENSNGKDGPVTGFYLRGFDGPSTTQASGPALGSCPDPHSMFVLGSMVTSAQSTTLTATFGDRSFTLQ